jgi:hypothetical protein
VTVDSVLTVMPRQSRTLLLNPEPKADAVKAQQRLHERAAAVTRESIWTRAYIMRLSPTGTGGPFWLRDCDHGGTAASRLTSWITRWRRDRQSTGGVHEHARDN